MCFETIQTTNPDLIICRTIMFNLSITLLLLTILSFFLQDTTHLMDFLMSCFLLYVCYTTLQWSYMLSFFFLHLLYFSMSWIACVGIIQSVCVGNGVSSQGIVEYLWLIMHTLSVYYSHFIYRHLKHQAYTHLKQPFIQEMTNRENRRQFVPFAGSAVPIG